jgi:hypothetical protein
MHYCNRFIGCLRSDRGASNDIKFTFAKKPKATIAIPRGFIIHAYNVRNDDVKEGLICIYAYMDITTVVYIYDCIDSVHGPLSECELITRKTNRGNTVFKNMAPLAFTEYNLNMNAVDIFNQKRTGWYSTEMDHSSGRWTIRLF